MKLDNTHSGKQVLGSERSVDIELDRNTLFMNVDTSAAETKENWDNDKIVEDAEGHDLQAKRIQAGMTKSYKCITLPGY